jgi:hypothetical protein
MTTRPIVAARHVGQQTGNGQGLLFVRYLAAQIENN